MLAKCFRAALPALSQEALEIDPKRTALTARDFQLYCYYGGMVLTGGDLPSAQVLKRRCPFGLLDHT